MFVFERSNRSLVDQISLPVEHFQNAVIGLVFQLKRFLQLRVRHLKCHSAVLVGSVIAETVFDFIEIIQRNFLTERFDVLLRAFVKIFKRKLGLSRVLFALIVVNILNDLGLVAVVLNK